MSKKQEPARILHVLGALELGGAESRIMDLYRCIDKEKMQFDFMIHTTKECYFNKEIRELGGNIYCVPCFRLYNYFSYKKAWKVFFEEHKEFQAVHGHMTSTATIYLPVAKVGGVPITIAHARSAGVDKGLKGKLTRFLRRNLAKRTDLRIACSQIAAESVFGKKAADAGEVKIIPNAIDLEQFNYDRAKREEMRKELGVSNKWVIGHVGRFHYAKNHLYLIRIFAEIVKQNDDAVLMLLGDGDDRGNAEAFVEELGLREKVLFMGNKKNVSDYYQAMDYVVFPSRYEGLPGTIVEAQAAGLRCLISDTIASEVACTDLVSYESIEKEPKVWAEVVIAGKEYERGNKIEEMRQKGFDVSGQASMYEEIYEVRSDNCR